MTEQLKLEEFWNERELAERLDLPIKPSGRSIQLSHWIQGGLVHMEKSGRRYFHEQDVVNYLVSRKIKREVE